MNNGVNICTLGVWLHKSSIQSRLGLDRVQKSDGASGRGNIAGLLAPQPACDADLQKDRKEEPEVGAGGSSSHGSCGTGCGRDGVYRCDRAGGTCLGVLLAVRPQIPSLSPVLQTKPHRKVLSR